MLILWFSQVSIVSLQELLYENRRQQRRFTQSFFSLRTWCVSCLYRIIEWTFLIVFNMVFKATLISDALVTQTLFIAREDHALLVDCLTMEINLTERIYIDWDCLQGCVRLWLQCLWVFRSQRISRSKNSRFWLSVEVGTKSSRLIVLARQLRFNKLWMIWYPC